MISFINIISIYLEVVKTVFPSLSTIELKFSIASLTPTRSVL